MRKTALVISCAILIFSFFLAYYFYADLPQNIATHWGVSGQPNGFSDKNMVLFLPFLSLFLFLILVYLPKIDPLRKNIDKFKESYDDFILVFLLLMFYISSLTLLWNLGLVFNMTLAIIPAMSFLFFFLGVLLSTVKRNYIIGARTPWALANDDVWDKTNKAAGKLFKGVGVITLCSILVLEYSFYILFISLIGGLIYIYVYSYLEYRKLTKEGGKKEKHGK